MGEGLLPLKYNPQIVMRDVTFGYGIGIQIPYTDDGKGKHTNRHPLCPFLSLSPSAPF